jgi:hypothetical protein
MNNKFWTEEHQENIVSSLPWLPNWTAPDSRQFPKKCDVIGKVSGNAPVAVDCKDLPTASA